MSAPNGTSNAVVDTGNITPVENKGKGVAAQDDKGKGKAVQQTHDNGMDVDESSSEEEVDEGVEAAEVDEPDDDNLEEIDPENIIPNGRRTRGRTIDFAKAAEEMGPEEEDEDDDDDFEAAEDDEMKD